nr:reverse transcriptase domain-containing protein [Tanacetum cinerariifolium]
MRTNEKTPLCQPTFAVRNTLGKEQDPQDLGMTASDAALRDYCDKNYHQFLPIIAEKVHQEKVQQERLKEVKARLNFEETSQHSDSGTLSRRGDLKKRLGPRHARSMSEGLELRHDHSESPRKRDPKRKTMFKRLKKGVFHRLGDKGNRMSTYSNDSRRRSYYSSRRDTESCYRSSHSRETEFAFEKHHNKRASSRRMEALSKSEGSAGGHLKSKPKRQKSNVKDDLSQPWVCEETNPFTPRIRYFDFPKARMPSHIKTYNISEDTEDHLKIFHVAAKTEHWAMPTWCHMFNSTLMGNARVWFDDLLKESIDGYDDLKEAFLENYLQQKKCIKYRSKFTISRREMGNLQKNLYRVRSRTEAKLQEGRILEPTKVKAKARQIHPPHKNTKRNPGFGQREVQASSSNDNLELKQSSGKDQAKVAKKGKPQERKKSLAILMVQSWQRVAKQKITQTFSPESVISFLPLGEENGMEEILHGHCFNKSRPKARSQMIPATTSLVGFSREIIWPLGKISLLVKIGDKEHSTSAWVMVVRFPSPYNIIVRRPVVRRIQAVSTTTYEMLKFHVAGRTVTLRSSRIIPLAYTMVSGPGVPQTVITKSQKKKSRLQSS